MQDQTAATANVLELTGERVRVRTLLTGLWNRRSLVVLLARKSFFSGYRSAGLGVLWSVLLPLVQGAVLAVVFSRIVRIHVAYNYPVFVISAMITWSYFSTSVSTSATSIVDSSGIATKVYFPRLILPVVAPLANLVGYAISMVTVLVLMVALGVPLKPSIVLLPVAVALAVVLAACLGALLSVAHVYYRDVRYLLQAVMMVWFYATPVIYPLELAGRLRPFIELNPVTGIVQLARHAIFGEATALLGSLRSTLVVIALSLFAVVLAYSRHDRVAVDRL